LVDLWDMVGSNSLFYFLVEAGVVLVTLGRTRISRDLPLSSDSFAKIATFLVPWDLAMWRLRHLFLSLGIAVEICLVG